MKLEVSRRILEKSSKYKILWKSFRQVRAELFHADRRTDGHEAKSRFS
jgi:hypothetical protein